MTFDFSELSLAKPFARSQSPYCFVLPRSVGGSWQCFSSCPRRPQKKQKLGNLSYLKETQNFSPYVLTMFPPLRSGLSMGRSTRILINLACSGSQDRLSDSIYLPSLLPSSLPTSSDMQSKGKPQTWTQNGEWVKEMVAIDSPFLHLVRSRRLLSKFQGPFRSTHSIWHIKVNLNCRMFCPTSTICRTEPIFQANQSVLFRARRF